MTNKVYYKNKDTITNKIDNSFTSNIVNYCKSGCSSQGNIEGVTLSGGKGCKINLSQAMSCTSNCSIDSIAKATVKTLQDGGITKVPDLKAYDDDNVQKIVKTTNITGTQVKQKILNICKAISYQELDQIDINPGKCMNTVLEGSQKSQSKSACYIKAALQLAAEITQEAEAKTLGVKIGDASCFSDPTKCVPLPILGLVRLDKLIAAIIVFSIFTILIIAGIVIFIVLAQGKALVDKFRGY